MTENIEHFDEWNTFKKPGFTYLPIRQMRTLLQSGKEQEALHEYCRTTSGGLAEARGIVEAIRNGDLFRTPHGYTGWKTGGVPMFWCNQCNAARQHAEVKRQIVPGGDWDDGVVYGNVCRICQSETKEFHEDQYGKVLGQFADLAITQVNLPPIYTERITQGLARGVLVRIAMQTHERFCEGSMSLPEAIEYESALENGSMLLQFIVNRGELTFEQVAQDILTGKSLRAK